MGLPTLPTERWLTATEALAEGDFRRAVLAVIRAAHPSEISETYILMYIHEALNPDYEGEDPIDATLDALIELTAGGLLQIDEQDDPAEAPLYRFRMQPGGNA